MNYKLNIALFTLLALSVLSSAANAQVVIKSIKCAEITASDQLKIYQNFSGTTKTVSFQVVKDRCRPKLTGGAIRLSRGTTTYTVTRLKNITTMFDISVANTQTVDLYFLPFSGARASGTLDYVLHSH